MNDPEFRKMLNKAIFIVAVVIVFAIPVFFIFKNKILVEASSLVKDVENDKTMLLYVVEDNCKNCKTIKKELDKKDIEYEEVNKDRYKDYSVLLKKLDLNSSNIYAPALIYIEKGDVVSYIVDLDSKERLNEYINSYK